MHGFCPSCAEEVEMMPFDLAISYSGIGGRDLMRASENGEIHSVETTAGHLLICKRSLAKGEKNEKPY
jgi:hypothetical protein